MMPRLFTMLAGTMIAAVAAPPGALADEHAVEALLGRMSLRQKAAQMVMPWVPGGMRPGTREYRRAEQLVAVHRVGGLVVGKGDRDATARTIRVLQQRSAVPILVASDLEWGAGMRLVGETLLPVAMAVAATGDTALAYAHGRATAAEARAAGLNMALGPVLDVNIHPRNPIINTRSFGADASLVASFGAATIRGLQDGGLVAVGKHFPGHGDTDQDSHVTLPRIGATRARLDSVELAPFRAAIGASIGGILVGHLAVPAIAGDETPASLSRATMTTLLRREMDFDGLVVTDALNMAGVSRFGEVAGIALRAVLAGADILLQPSSPELAIDAIVEAVERGQVSRARVDASVRRILRAKHRAGLLGPAARAARSDVVTPDVAPSHLADSIATRSLTLVRDAAALVPLRPAQPVLSLAFARSGVPGGPNTAFDATLQAHGVFLERRTLSAQTAGALADSLLAAWAGGTPPVVIVASYTQPVPSRHEGSMPDAVAAAIERIGGGAPLVHVVFGDPYVSMRTPSARTVMLAWSGIPAAQRAAARALLGLAPPSGRLPIALSPAYQIGHGLGARDSGLGTRQLGNPAPATSP